MALRKRKVNTFLWSCRCERCGHTWTTLADEKPGRCPGCKSRGWEKPARTYTRRAAS